MDKQGWLSRAALRSCAWAERWFPDAWAFAALAVVAVALAAVARGAAPLAAAQAFGDGFWSLIPFTMQMCFIIIGGYVVAASPPVARAIEALARLPRSGRGAVCLVALLGMLVSLLHWGLSLVFSGLLVQALARREELRMDYRAAGAAAYLGLGAVWALGLSSSAAQLQANPASMTPALLAITGVIPFAETIFLWQSLLLTAVLIAVSVAIAWLSAPSGAQARTAAELGVALREAGAALPPRTRPGEWLEWSPLLSLLLAALGLAWLGHEIAAKGLANAISSLNTYNFLFLTVGLLLNWRPRRFLDAVNRAVPSAAGVLIQFPLYGGIAAILTAAKGADGQTLAQQLAGFFTHIATPGSFPAVMGAYSAVLGFFVPSGGGKWLIEAPYVMQAANELHVHLGWAVQVYNAAEALPNLVNPFWMLPLLGILGLKARDLVGYSALQFAVHLPLVLTLLWVLGLTLEYHPPLPAVPH
ncbi:MAG TPA: TIGR00366 family protein [Nevskia sp.]|nr:TIGR00366 family protein [Nevskia sp.]